MGVSESGSAAGGAPETWAEVVPEFETGHRDQLARVLAWVFATPEEAWEVVDDVGPNSQLGWPVMRPLRPPADYWGEVLGLLGGTETPSPRRDRLIARARKDYDRKRVLLERRAGPDGSAAWKDDPVWLSIFKNPWREEQPQPLHLGYSVLARYTDLLGPDHDDILDLRHELARLTGDAAGLMKVLADRLRLQDPDHPKILHARASIAELRTGDEAVAAYSELLAERLRLQGPEHKDTFTTRFRLAYAHADCGDTERAAQELADILADKARLLGPDDPGVLSSRKTVAIWRCQNGDPAGGARALADVYADYRRVLGPDATETRIVGYQSRHWRKQAGWWRRLRRRE